MSAVARDQPGNFRVMLEKTLEYLRVKELRSTLDITLTGKFGQYCVIMEQLCTTNDIFLLTWKQASEEEVALTNIIDL